ncbi:hypothetical protein AABB02_00195 [Streptomyces rimosus]|uniref:hypothetical protein n=1 Tax=Streptomyces rimosus TaxID=1927 RepID=UPI0031D18C28
MSATGLGVRARFVYAARMYIRRNLDTLVREFRMPSEETESALMRLAALGHPGAFDEQHDL